jgi:iron complex outermembrane receptor protein
MVNATLAYDVGLDRVGLGDIDGQIFLRGTNLLDEKALNHASFISNLAPLRGRNVVLGFRARF